MALDRGDEDILARALTKALRDAGWRGGGAGGGGAGGGGAGGGGGGGGSRSGGGGSDDDMAGRRRARKLGDLQQKLIETSRELLALDQNEIENTLKGQRLKKKHDLILQEASRSLKQATDEIKPGTFSQMYADVRAFSRNTEGLTSKLAQATKNASLFSAGMIQSHELIEHGSHAYRDFMSNMGSAAGKLNKSFLRQNKLINDITGEIRTNIDPAAIAQLRIKTGRIQAMMIEQLSSLGLKDVSQLSPQELARRTATGQQTGAGSAQEMHRAILTVARQLQAEGVINAGDLSDATKVNYAELAQKVQGAGASLRDFNSTVDAEGKRASSIWSRYITGGATTLHGAVTNYAKKLTDTATIMANAGKAVAASKGVYQDLMRFNISGLATGFADAEKMSIRMGMSFEDTVSYLQENKRMLGLYGSTEFQKLNSDFETTFQKFGYTMQQGAAAVGPTIEAAVAAGIDVRSGKELNKYMQQTTESFAEVSGFISESLPEYAKLTAALYNESEIKTTLLGLDGQRSALYARSLQQQRDELTTRGISLQQAQEVIKLQERAKREKVSSRIQSGAMLAIQAQQLGMGQEGQRAMRIKAQGTAASKEDTAWLTGTFLPEFAKRRAQYGAELEGTGAGGAQMMRDQFLDLTEVTGATGEQIKALEEAVIKEKAGVKPTAAEKEKIKREAAGSESIAKMGNAVNTVTSVINNNFVVALYSATAALAGLAGSALLGAGIRGAVGAAATGGIGAGLSALAGGAAAALGRVAGVAKGVLKGGAAAVVGTGVSMAGEYAKEKGYEKTGTALDIGGTALQGAGTGAMLGSFFGPLGTAIGAGVGGVLGAGYGIYKNVTDDEDEKPGEQQEATSKAKPVEDSPLTQQQDRILKAQQDAVAQAETAGAPAAETAGALTSLTSAAQSLDSAFKQLQLRVLANAAGTVLQGAGTGSILGGILGGILSPIETAIDAVAAGAFGAKGLYNNYFKNKEQPQGNMMGGLWDDGTNKNYFKNKEQPQGANTASPPTDMSVSGTIKMGKPEGAIQFNGKTVNPGDPDYEAASKALMAQKRKAEMMRTPAGRKAYFEEIKKNPPAQPAVVNTGGFAPPGVTPGAAPDFFAKPGQTGRAVVVNTAGFAPPGIAPGTAPDSPAVNTAVQGLPADGGAPVSDLTAQQKLEIIATNMIEAVSLLKQISTNTDAGTKEIRSSRPATVIPNQSAYLTGRVQ
jgi:hypothetical protein